MDVSLLTDAWFDDLRVLDVEKQALQVLAHGLSACGDAMKSSPSRPTAGLGADGDREGLRRGDEGDDKARIAALKPGYYSPAWGAAIRHPAARLSNGRMPKLLIVLTDGKPNDVDHYEGRFALEDTAGSRRSAPLGHQRLRVTVDGEARSYLPVIFGQDGYAVVSNIGRLPAALPAIYRGLVR